MKNFFINNSVEALILLREGHESLLKLHIHLEGEGGGGERGFQCVLSRQTFDQPERSAKI